jgi:uncharacterized protein
LSFSLPPFTHYVLTHFCLTVAGTEGISPEMILSAAPYFQRNTTRQQAVQIDLLIHTQYTLYVCEVKFRKKLGVEIIEQMIEKIKRLKIPEHLSVRPVLIYQGHLSSILMKSNYFSHMLQFADFLEAE